MSLARRVLARRANGLQFDFTARKERLEAGEAGLAARNDNAGDASADDQPAPGSAPRRGRPHSPARSHQQRKAAGQMDAAGAAAPDLTAYQQMQVLLHSDQQALKQIQSTELKINYKRGALPAYAPWVQGRLEADKDGVRAVQDDVLAHVLVWSIDVADYSQALTLAAYFQRHKLALPERMKRDVATFVVEEIAEAAQKAYRAGGEAAADFPADVLLQVDVMFAEADMPDPVRAKLKKAIGQALLVSVEQASDAGDEKTIGCQKAALEVLKRAQELDPASGCVKLIEGLERGLKKLDADPAS